MYVWAKLKQKFVNLCFFKLKATVSSANSINKISLAEKTPEPVMLKENVSGNDQDDGPIVCEVDGLKTYNYNHPPKIIIPEGFQIEKLSDSSNDDEVINEVYKDSSLIETQVQKSTKGQEALELKNWFPKKKRARSSRDLHDSSSSYDPEFVYSDDSGMELQKTKRTKINSWLRDITSAQSKNGIQASSFMPDVTDDKNEDESIDDSSTESSDSDVDVRPIINKTQKSEKSSSAISSMSAQNDDNEADDEDDDGYGRCKKKSKKKSKKIFAEQRIPSSSESEGL